MADWQPSQYLKYRSERTQPAIDLVNRLSLADPKRIIDIGCGPGNSTAILKERWPDAAVCGLDNSANMLAKAKREYADIDWLQMSVEEDLSALGKFDLVFTNAALQWMPAHETLLPDLYGMLCENGVLAAQVPCVKHLPVYANIQSMIGTDRWARYFEHPPVYPKHFPFAHYYDILCGLTDRIEIWQTDYIHILPDHDGIVEWYKGTGLRPFLDMLPDDALRADFCEHYRQLIEKTYSVERDGRVLLPFTRIFFVAYK